MRGAPVAVVLVLAALLRFGGLSSRLVWHDEVYTQIFAGGRSARDWAPVLYAGKPVPVGEILALQQRDVRSTALDTARSLASDEPQHPPLYYLLARIWTGALGHGIGALRSLSAAASLLAVLSGYWLCRELSFSPKTAIFAAALLAVSPFFVLYGQEAREYALWSLFVLVSSALLCRALRLTEQGQHIPVGSWLMLSMAVALGLYTSFSMAPVALAQSLFVALRAKMRPDRASLCAALAMLVSAALFSPWALLLWRHFEAFQASMRWASLTVIPRAELLTMFALNVSRPLVDAGEDLADPLVLAAIAWGCAVAAYAAWSLREAPRDARLLLWSLALVPLVPLLLPDLLFGGIRSISARYLTPTLLSVALASAWSLTREPPERGRLGLGGVVLALALLSSLHGASQVAPWSKGVSVDLPEIAALVDVAPRPLVIGSGERHHPGNLLALSRLLDEDTELMIVPPGASLSLPAGDFAAVFLFSPIPPYLEDLRLREGREAEVLYESVHASLWRVR